MFMLGKEVNAVDINGNPYKKPVAVKFFDELKDLRAHTKRYPLKASKWTVFMKINELDNED